MSSTTGTIRFALLAYSVYCWVDGSTRARGLGFQPNPLEADEADAGEGGVWGWLLRPGTKMDEEEQGTLAKVDITSAFVLFNTLQRIDLPLHIHSTIPLGIPHLKHHSRLNWRLLTVITVVLSLFHETKRAAIVYRMRQRRSDLSKDLANMQIGEVTVRGNDVTHASQDLTEDETECLICSGSDETASNYGDRSTTVTGPLEAFCTLAPQKHLMHRACFLQWHAAYVQQSHRSFAVELIGEDHELQPTESSFVRAGIILRAAGFEYLVARLSRRTRNQDGPKLLLHLTPAQLTTQPLLATLRTCAPPCPGCRSPVALRFVDTRPPRAPVPRDPVTPYSLRAFLRSPFWRVWTRVVTGQTLGAYLSSLLSFMVVLNAITRAREGKQIAIGLGAPRR